jgi:MFS family permease
MMRSRLGVVGERDFGCYWLARTLSLFGDYAFRTAFATYIISESDSPTVLATGTAVLLVPALIFFLVGGVVGDRAGSRRRVMVVADLARFVTLLLIAASTVLTDDLVVLVVLAMLIGVADGFFMPVSFAYLQEITPKDRLVSANSALSVSQQVAIIGGPLVGGLLVGLAGAAWAFAFDGGTFLASAVLLLLIRRTAGRTGRIEEGDRDEPAAGVGHLRQLGGDVAQAFRYVSGVHWLVIAIVVGACTNAVYAGVLDVAVPLIMAPDGTRDAPSLGAFYAVQGLGALVGAAVLATLVVRRIGLTLYLMLALMAGSLAAAGAIGGGVATVAVALAYGFGLHFFNSLFPAVMQDKVDPGMLSRVSSLAYLGFFGLMPLGTLVMGPMVTWLGAGGAAIAGGLAAGAISLTALLAPSVRQLEAATAADQTATDAELDPVRRS